MKVKTETILVKTRSRTKILIWLETGIYPSSHVVTCKVPEPDENRFMRFHGDAVTVVQICDATTVNVIKNSEKPTFNLLIVPLSHLKLSRKHKQPKQHCEARPADMKRWMCLRREHKVFLPPSRVRSRRHPASPRHVQTVTVGFFSHHVSFFCHSCGTFLSDDGVFVMHCGCEGSQSAARGV